MVRAEKYVDSAVTAIKKISSRISRYSVKSDRYPDLLAWGQHIDEKVKGQYGLYGTSGAIEIIDRIDSDESSGSSYSRPIPEELKKAIDFLEKFLANEAETTTEGSMKHQLTLIPKLCSLLSSLSKRLADNYAPAGTLRSKMIDRIKRSQNKDGGWPPYNPKLLDDKNIQPESDPLITALVMSAVSKASATSDVRLHDATSYLLNSLRSESLPLHTRLYSLFAIRCANPEISVRTIKKFNNAMIREFDKTFDNLIEIYCPYDAAMLPEHGAVGAHYFVVKQKTLLLHYLARFEYWKFCDKKWIDRATKVIQDIDANDGGKKSRISYRIGTRNTLSATLFLIISKNKVKDRPAVFNFKYYLSSLYRSMLLQFIGTAWLIYIISPYLVPLKTAQSFIYDVLKSMASTLIIFILGKIFWSRK